MAVQFKIEWQVVKVCVIAGSSVSEIICPYLPHVYEEQQMDHWQSSIYVWCCHAHHKNTSGVVPVKCSWLVGQR